eukprot:877397-Pyramimonas_sp.AAC.1
MAREGAETPHAGLEDWASDILDSALQAWEDIGVVDRTDDVRLVIDVDGLRRLRGQVGDPLHSSSASCPLPPPLELLDGSSDRSVLLWRKIACQIWKGRLSGLERGAPPLSCWLGPCRS